MSPASGVEVRHVGQRQSRRGSPGGRRRPGHGRPAERSVRLVWVEAALAAVAFAALCAVVLAVGAPKKAAEPDDGAYHYSIVAITMGDFFTLSSAQLNALDTRMGDPGGR